MTDDRRLYVIVIRYTAYWLVGPFPDLASMWAWGDYERANGDDLRWQSIMLYPYEAPNAKPIDWHPYHTP